MEELAIREPGYNWEANMGYPTFCHKKAIDELGITTHHRKSFTLYQKKYYLPYGRSNMPTKELQTLFCFSYPPSY
ncbi:ribonuclease H family protein [Candidatus Amoebophilus asiaticus]|uniref:hypothetical protein n=1 Tax=Candidatus Amoebophilus asiaticus TaxID=281120 RepID=UPI0001714F65|nr:hypothetical protein [Candidatus Amoebophilus asiaticus]